MKSSSQRLVARFAASALSGLALTGAATSALAQETPPDSAPPVPPTPPVSGPVPAPPAADVDASSLSPYTEDLRKTRPTGQLILLPRDQALLLSTGETHTVSGCPTNLRGAVTDDGMRPNATLYDEHSVQQSAERGTVVCVYFISSFVEPLRVTLGRRLSGEGGPVRADLVSRADWA
jgi:hypothetical protein